jgi:hypothetical protein
MTTAADYLESCLKSLRKAEREMMSVSTLPENLSDSEGWEECNGSDYGMSLADAGGAVQSAISELLQAMKVIGLDDSDGTVRLLPTANPGHEHTR